MWGSPYGMNPSQARLSCACVCIGPALVDQQFHHMLTVNLVASGYTPHAQGWMPRLGLGDWGPVYLSSPVRIWCCWSFAAHLRSQPQALSLPPTQKYASCISHGTAWWNVSSSEDCIMAVSPERLLEMNWFVFLCDEKESRKLPQLSVLIRLPLHPHRWSIAFHRQPRRAYGL